MLLQNIRREQKRALTLKKIKTALKKTMTNVKVLIIRIIAYIEQLKMSAFSDPNILVYWQNRIRSFLHMERMLEFVHIRENKDTILFIYGNIRMRKSPHFGTLLHRGFLTRLSTKISLCLKIARYKEVSAIEKVNYREVLPCDEFIIQQFSINQTYVRCFDRNSALFNFCIQLINCVNLISRYKKVVKS